MKRRTQKIFITLLSLFIAGFAMVNAYTFEVLNWNPFWVLNLKTLIMKPDVNTTWIIIDGASYTIKIDPNHETEDWWIWVDRICEESWVNCKKVSELWIWGWGTIVIEGDAENFCFKKDDTTLLCDNNFLRSLIESWWLGWSINIDGQDKNYCYRSKETNTLYCDNTNLPTWNWSTPGNGKITIIQWSNEREFFLNGTGDQKITLSNWGGTTNGAIAYWSGEYICVKNGNNLDCSKAKLWELKPDKRCTFDGTSINCNETKPSWGNGWTTYTAWTAIEITNDVISVKPNALLQPGYVAAPTQKWKCWKTDPITGQPLRWDCWWGWDWITLITWQNNMYCKYIESNDGKWGTTTKWIQCTYDAWSSTSPTWSWDSLWKSTLSWNDRYYLQPKLTNGTYRVELYPWSSTTTYWAASKIVFDSKWIRINNGAQFYSWAWLSVAWNIMVWNTSTDNYIYIYATWNNKSDNKRFEIFWNQELSIWTTDGSYLYFAQKSWTVWYRLWVNTSDPKATLDVKWWIRIGSNCEQRICTGTNVWTIIYTAARWFIGCKYISSNNYKRVSLDGWTRSGTSYATNQTCQIYSYSNDIVSNTTTQNEY